MKKYILLFLLCCLSVSFCFSAFSDSTSTNGWSYCEQEDGTILLLKYNGNETEVVIPDIIEGKPVTAIDADLIVGQALPSPVTFPIDGATIKSSTVAAPSFVTEVTIPNSVVTVYGNPFHYCDKLDNIIVSPDHPTLEMVGGTLFSKPDRRLICALKNTVQGNYVIPDGTRIIGQNAFCHCYDMTGITIPDSISEIEDGAFEQCRKLTGINIPEGVSFVGANAFSGCASLVDIVLPDSVTEIRDKTFQGCTSLTGIVLPDRVTAIRDRAFSGCNRLRTINFPNGVVSIGEEAFASCYLSEISLPHSVKSIGSGAFSHCINLSRVRIDGPVETIEDNPFIHCDKLKEIVISEDNPCLEVRNGALFSKQEHRLIFCPYHMTDGTYIVPEETEIIGNRSFVGCNRLQQVHLPDSVTVIGDYAFCECTGLSEINIPKTLEYVGKRAFYNCFRLKGKLSLSDHVTTGEDALTFDPVSFPDLSRPEPDRQPPEPYQVILLIAFAVIMVHLISCSVTILISKKKSIRNGYSWGLLLGIIGIVIMLLKKNRDPVTTPVDIELTAGHK